MILRRLLSLIVACAVLLVSSGTALLLHERIAHAAPSDGRVVAAARLHAVAGFGTSLVHGDRNRDLDEADCPVCQLLTHFVASLAVAAGLLLALFASVAVPRPRSVEPPAFCLCPTPRSTRGPPALCLA